VECNFASLLARDCTSPDLEDEERRDERSKKSVTRKEVEGAEENWPQPKDCGQRVVTALCMACRDAFSPGDRSTITFYQQQYYEIDVTLCKCYTR
jgi:hypothetical protein